MCLSVFQNFMKNDYTSNTSNNAAGEEVINMHACCVNNEVQLEHTTRWATRSQRSWS